MPAVPHCPTSRPPRTAILTLLGLSLGLSLATRVAAADPPASAPPGQSITFHFNPPDDSQVERTVVRIIERDVDGKSAHRDEAESVTLGRFHKTVNGWSFERRATRFEFRHDGEVVVNPLAELEARAELQYHLEPDGHVHDIKGFGGMDDRLQKTYAPDVAIRFAPAMKFMGEETLVAQERDDWNACYADLSGKTVKLGSEESSEMQYPLPTGLQLSYEARTRFRAMEPCPAGTCVRIDISYTSGRGKTGADSSGDHLTGSASRLVDPATMRVFEEHFERNVVAVVQAAGKPSQTVKRREEIRYTWRYP